MKTTTIVDAALDAAAKLRPVAGASLPASTAALAPLISLLPKILPFVVRTVRRHPTQTIVAGVGLLLLAAAQRRRTNGRRYSPYLD